MKWRQLTTQFWPRPTRRNLITGMERPWLIMLMPYFGRWPEWINLFMVTCGANKNIHWRFITDCGPPEHRPANTEFHQISFDDYKRLLSRKLGFLFDHDAYKANELRVALGYVYETDIREFEFYGYGDIDVVWGDIDSFYLPLRAEYDFITTVSDLVAGHFSIFRNTDQLRRAFMRTPGYPELLQVPGQTSFEEVNFARTFKESAHWTSDPPRALFRNQYATVLSPRGWHDGTLNYPQEWYWRDGHLTNNADGSREFLYLPCGGSRCATRCQPSRKPKVPG
jgi:hypothetical protein